MRKLLTEKEIDEAAAEAQRNGEKVEMPGWIARAEQAAKEAEVVPITAIKRKRLRPVNAWVLIRKMLVKDKITEEGVVLTEAQKRSSMGEVIAVADGVPLKVGDQVIYTNFPIELEDIEELTGEKALQLVRWEEIYSVVEDIPEEVACT